METHIITSNPSNPEQFVTMNGVLGAFTPSREILNALSLPVHKKSTADFNPLADTQTLFSSVSSIFEKFDAENATNSIHVLREGHFNGQDQDQDYLIPLILISEPLLYEGCEWDPSKPQTPPVVEDQKSQSIQEEKEATATPTSEQKSSNRLSMKPKALRDLLELVGTIPNGTPLFPEGPEPPSSPNVKKSTRPNNPGSIFFQKLRHPAASEIVKSLKRFETFGVSFEVLYILSYLDLPKLLNNKLSQCGLILMTWKTLF